MPNLPRKNPDCYISPGNLAAKTRLWLKRIEPFNRHEMHCRSNRSCLLVIDMQNYFKDPQGSRRIRGLEWIIEAFNKVVEACQCYRCESRIDVVHPDCIREHSPGNPGAGQMKMSRGS